MTEKFDYYTIKSVFERAEEKFRSNNKDLFARVLSERTLCGALMISLHDVLSKTMFSDYYVDVEFNRYYSNNSNDIKCLKRIDTKEKRKRIFCDLIVHGRGKLQPDNLIAVEMKKIQRKKSRATEKVIDDDKERLKILTALNNEFCYVLGVYYEVNYKDKMVYIEYYHNGELSMTDHRLLQNVI